MTTQWLSIVDFARHYNISDMTVRRRIKTGKLQAILREGKYYIPSGAGVGDIGEESPVSFSPPSVPRVRGEEAFSFSPQRVDAERLVNLSPAPVVVSKSIHAPHSEVLTASGETSALVEFCHAALAKFNKLEDQLKSHYHSNAAALEEKIKHLEAALALSKEREARSQQEVQDLQLLLQMMEKADLSS
jgi:hypothetical protein